MGHEAKSDVAPWETRSEITDWHFPANPTTKQAPFLTQTLPNFPEPSEGLGREEFIEVPPAQATQELEQSSPRENRPLTSEGLFSKELARIRFVESPPVLKKTKAGAAPQVEAPSNDFWRIITDNQSILENKVSRKLRRLRPQLSFGIKNCQSAMA